MKVLVSAFSCGPGEGSDPAVGWNWVVQISRQHDVWLITTDEYREKILQASPANVRVTFLPSYRFWSRLGRLPFPGLDWLYYYWWQWRAYRVGRRLHAEIGFALVHHVTFVTWRTPSFLSLLPVPFIWGPVGGAGVPPRGLRVELGWKGRFFEALRRWSQDFSRWDPLVRMTMRRARVILAANQETAEVIPPRYRAKTRLMLGIGMSEAEKPDETAPVPVKPGFVVLLVALLRPIKGGPLALRAFERVARARPEATMVVIGSGDEGRRLAALAERLGIADRVKFVGGLPRAQVLGWMRAGDVLLHPSLRDSGGLVLLEAMAAGKPAICLDLGGPGEIVNPECGIKVRPGNPEQVVADLAAGLEKLAGDPVLRRAMGEAGRRRVRTEFDWDKRGNRMMEIYREVAGVSAER